MNPRRVHVRWFAAFAKYRMKTAGTRMIMSNTDRVLCWACILVIPVMIMLCQPCIDPTPKSYLYIDYGMTAFAIVASFRLARLSPALFERIWAGLMLMGWLGVTLFLVVVNMNMK